MMPAASASSPTSRASKSHDIIRRGLEILVNLDHRGAVGADPLVGDGAGCLIQMPDALLRDWAERTPASSCRRPATMPSPCASCRATRRRGSSPSSSSSTSSRPRARSCSAGATCRSTPTGLGEAVLEAMPVIRQAIVAAGPQRQRPGRLRAQDPGHPQADPEQHHAAGGRSTTCPALTELYMPSFSTRTVVYKGLLLAPPGRHASTRTCSDPLTRVGAGAGAPALLHQHLPVLEAGAPLPLHRPQRRDQHRARQRQLDERAPPHAWNPTLLGPDLDKMWPLIPHGQSDTACLDNALELLVAGGYPLAHAMMMLIPEAWAGNPLMDAGAARLLRIPRRADGAVGRPGRDRLHRRPPDRRHARPQRPAPGALRRHRRRPRDHGLRGRRAAGRRRSASSASGACSPARCC